MDNEISQRSSSCQWSSKSKIEKKCPKCNSIGSDSEVSRGVCGASLSSLTSQRLEQLVHREPEIKAKKKLSISGLALVTATLTMKGVGAFLVVIPNAFGVFLLLAGLILIMYIFGGAGAGIGRGNVACRKRRLGKMKKNGGEGGGRRLGLL